MTKTDITEAEKTFVTFVTLVKWGTIVSFAVAFIVLLIIAS